MKLLAVVVLYHPDGDVLANIRTYLPGVDCLLLWDNTPRDCIDRERLGALQALEKSVYMGKGENVGIGEALNVAVDYARQHGFTHLITFDQDSRFASDDFGRYLEAVRNWGGGCPCHLFNKLLYQVAAGSVVSGGGCGRGGLFGHDFREPLSAFPFRGAGWIHVRPVCVGHRLRVLLAGGAASGSDVVFQEHFASARLGISEAPASTVGQGGFPQ